MLIKIRKLIRELKVKGIYFGFILGRLLNKCFDVRYLREGGGLGP